MPETGDRQAGATPEELEMAAKFWDALTRLSPNAAMAGDPRDGDMDVIFDGEFNLLLLVREVLKAETSPEQTTDEISFDPAVEMRNALRETYLNLQGVAEEVGRALRRARQRLENIPCPACRGEGETNLVECSLCGGRGDCL